MIHIQDSENPAELQLFDDAAHGPMAVRWERELEAGMYELRLELAPVVWRRDFIVRVDHRPVSVRSAYFNREGVTEQPPYVFRVLITESGLHWIEVDLGVSTFADCEQLLRDFEGGERPQEEAKEKAAQARPSMTIRAMHLDKCAMPVQGTAAAFPFHQQLWGWMPCSSYQRHFKRTMTRAYFERRVVDELAKWGSNYLQLHPLVAENYLADGDLRDALAYAHAWGFLMDEHGSWLGMEPYDKTIAQYDERMEAHFDAFLDRTELSAPRAMDGWESEDYNFSHPEHKPLETMERVLSSNHLTWHYHPGSFISQCRSLSPFHRELYLSRLHEGFHGPNYGKVLMCAGAYTGNGYDDLMPLEPFPHNWAVKNSYNWVHRVAQADCRVYSNNKYSSGAMLDWAVKQHWDFFRLNAEAQRDGRLPVMSGLTWLGEPNLTLPEDMREGVLAASLEPCRSAICYPLTTTGRDGLLYWRFPKGDIRYLKEGAGSGETALELLRDRERRYTPRDFTPAASWRIHNGILAATQSALGCKTELVWDSDELGQFDVNAPALKLSEDLFSTESAQPQAAKKLTFAASDNANAAQQVELDAGSYVLHARAGKAEPFRAEVWLMQQYLGSFEGGETRLPFCVVEAGTHTIELRTMQGKAPEIAIELRPTNHIVDTVAQIENFAEAAEACSLLGNEGPGGLPLHAEAEFAEADAAKNCPGVLDASSTKSPRALSLWFDAPAGNYLLTVRARTTADVQRLDVGLNAHLYSDGTKHVHQPMGFGTNDWVNEPGQYGRAGAWMLEGEWRTYQIVVAANHRSGKMRHKVELSTPAGQGCIEFASIRLSQTPVRHWTGQVGGHESKLEADATLVCGGTRIIEHRTLRMVAEEPTLFLDIHREVAGKPAALAACMDLRAYDKIRVDGKVLGEGESREGTPRWIEAVDSAGLLPALNLAFLQSGVIERVERTANGLRFLSAVSGVEDLRIAATLRQGVGETLAAYFDEESAVAELDTGGATISPKMNFGAVRLVRVKNPVKGPYFVREEGWWRVRGAQPLRTSAADWEAYLDAHDAWIGEADPAAIPEPPYGDDLVRVTVKPGDEPALQPHGFIDGCVRPGWGSQKQMLLGDVSAVGCTVRVLSVTPYVFAPRVEFAEAFTAVKLDGKPWAYHDGQHVFLPQQPGDYRIEVERKGAMTPTLLTTAASVKRAEYADGLLRIELGLPAYVFKTPEALHYHVLIGLGSDKTAIDRVEGGAVVREGPEGIVIRCDKMWIEVRFR